MPPLSVPHRLAFEVLIVVEGGHGTHFVDFRPYRVGRGDFLRLRPGQVHAFDPEATFAGLLFVMRADLSAPPTVGECAGYLPDADLGHVARIADLLFELQRSYEAHESAAHLVHAVFARAEALLHARAPATQDDLLLRFFARLDLEQGWSVQAHATALGCSARTLRRRCLDHLGVSAKRAVDDRRALAAKRALVRPAATVESVAEALDFSEATNFVKFFRRLTGTTPARFRADALTPGRGDSASAAGP